MMLSTNLSSCAGLHEACGGRAGQGVGEPRGGAEAEGGRRLLPDEAVDAGDLRRLGAQGAAAQPRRVRPHLRHRQPGMLFNRHWFFCPRTRPKYTKLPKH